MNREELREAMAKYISHPENIQDEILDKYWYLKSEDLEKPVILVIDEKMKMWEYIARQSELLYLLKSLNIIQ